jgi:beta-lactamase class A
MKKFPPIFILIFAFMSTTCSSSASQQPGNHSTNVQKNSLTAETNNRQDAELQKQIERISSAVKGRVGVTATVLETGDTVSLNANERFPMQSVYKLPIAMAVLQQVDAGKIKLERKVRVERDDFVRKGMRSPIRDENPNGVELSVNELLRYSVSESDGTASDVLMKLAGGAEAVMKYLNELKIKEITVLNTEKELGQDQTLQYRNWASPQASVDLLRALQERRGGFSEQSQALLLEFMTESPTGLKRLKGLLPKGTVVAHKTGTSGTVKGITAATNDIGIIQLANGRHLAIAVFVSDSPAEEATREKVIAEIAKAVWDKWSK